LDNTLQTRTQPTCYLPQASTKHGNNSNKYLKTPQQMVNTAHNQPPLKSMERVLHAMLQHPYSTYKQNHVMVVAMEDHMQLIVKHVQVHTVQACQYQE
jgi:hypothetical protein